MTTQDTVTATAPSAGTQQQPGAATAGVAVVPLDEPIKRGSTTISTLTLRRPNAGSLRGLNLVDIAQLNVTALQKLLPRISDPMLTEQDVAGMDPADLTACGSEVAVFLLSKRDRQQFL